MTGRWTASWLPDVSVFHLVYRTSLRSHPSSVRLKNHRISGCPSIPHLIPSICHESTKWIYTESNWDVCLCRRECGHKKAFKSTFAPWSFHSVTSTTVTRNKYLSRVAAGDTAPVEFTKGRKRWSRACCCCCDYIRMRKWCDNHTI